MDYKKIIQNQQLRFFILRMLSWLPSSIMLRIQYFIKLKRKLNLKKPIRFTEKIQYYKIHYRNYDMLRCTDKYLVRSFLKERNCEQYLNTLYGYYNDANEIDFDKLPNKFVLKSTDGSGGENILICRDKTELKVSEVIKTTNNWLNKKLGKMTREWAYEGAENSKIIIEKYLEDPSNEDNTINDYKFFCFDGKVEYLVVDVDRYSGHKRNFYTRDWIHLKVSSDCPMANRPLVKPNTFEEMISVAEKISNGFPFVRVDLYSIEEKVIFGEMTFYPWSGYVQFNPDSFDFELGSHFNINF